jgi:hypothetical protein
MFTLYFPDVDTNYFHYDPCSEYPYGYIAYKRNSLLTNSIYSKLTSQYISDYLCTLIQKDNNYTVNIYKYISENFRNRRLFHTYNHPTNELLNIVCTSFVNILGLEINHNVYTGEEIFGFYQDAIFEDTVENLQLRFKSKIIIHGKELTLDEFCDLHKKTLCNNT